MKQILAIIALFALLATGVGVFVDNAHHGDISSFNCLATCIREIRPVATAALIAVIILLFAIFETTGVVFTTTFSQRLDTHPRTRYRTQFDRWFSFLERSQTA